MQTRVWLICCLGLLLSACSGSGGDSSQGKDTLSAQDSGAGDLKSLDFGEEPLLDTLEDLSLSDSVPDVVELDGGADSVDFEVPLTPPEERFCKADKDCKNLTGDTCIVGFCDSGVCRTRPMADGVPCDDGDPCTLDACRGGVCSMVNEFECGGECGVCEGDQVCVLRKCKPLESFGQCPAGGALVANSCNRIDAAGCCEDEAVYYCGTAAEGTCPDELLSCLCRVDCLQNFGVCTWDEDLSKAACDQYHNISEPESLACPVACEPACGGVVCGPDGCGGLCGSCAEGLNCVAGQCLDTPCPEGQVLDCVGVCVVAFWVGDGVCDEGQYGAELNCEANNFDGGDCGECQPVCPGMACGHDGCGGLCGVCDSGSVCVGGTCSDQDCPEDQIPDCFLVCSPEVWIGDGTCDVGQFGAHLDCEQFNRDGGDCGQECTPDCEGKVCGGDGCGGTCGECPEASVCLLGQCRPSGCPAGLIEDCEGNCGNPSWVSDGYCDDGTWGNNFFCESFELDGGDCAVCTPDCTFHECGTDGCGGSCGTCPETAVCSGGVCVYNA